MNGPRDFVQFNIMVHLSYQWFAVHKNVSVIQQSTKQNNIGAQGVA